jgi:hypothetical protein
VQLGHTIKSPKLSSFFIVILLIIPLVFLNHSKNSFLGVITNYKPLSFSIGCFARISGSSFAFTSLTLTCGSTIQQKSLRDIHSSTTQELGSD